MIIWTDIETTGLDPSAHGHQPLEVAVVVTDDDLTPLHEVEFLVQADLRQLKTRGVVDDFITEMHTQNGLWAMCLNAPDTWFQVDTKLCEWYDSLGIEGKHPLGGSTISFDRGWLAAFFPNFLSRIHYRNIDVSTVKELCKRWRPEIAEKAKALDSDNKNHRAMDDIKVSIQEAIIYQEELFCNE